MGDFEPNLIKNKDLEFGFKRIPKDTAPDYHFHKLKTEYTILLEGAIYLEGSKQTIYPITCIKYDPLDKNDQYFLEDCLILIINSPSFKNDKFI